MSPAAHSFDPSVRPSVIGGDCRIHLSVHPDPSGVDEAAAACLASWLIDPATHTIMPAAGNSPLEMYRRIAARRMDLSRLSVFTLDEYVGVPRDEPRNCTQLLRRCVQEAWGIPKTQFHGLSSLAHEAPAEILEHERKIAAAGGLDVVVLGLGQNGHLGFNEPGSPEHGAGRLVDLDDVSIEANRVWFGGRFAPAQGVTTGLGVVLAARRILLLASGRHKAAAVHAMIRGPRHAACPASFLQGHPGVHVFLDAAAATALDLSS